MQLRNVVKFLLEAKHAPQKFCAFVLFLPMHRPNKHPGPQTIISRLVTSGHIPVTYPLRVPG